MLLRLYPGSSKAHRRALIMLRLRTWAFCFASDLAREDAALLERRAAITAECKASGEAAFLSSGPAAYGSVGQLTPEEAGWLTSFSDSITVSFVCRDASCLWFGRNDQWVIHRDQRHFRCSLCGKFYSPWTCSGGEVPFQKVIAMRSPVSAATMCFGAKWPGSEGDLWLLRQCEAYPQHQAGPRGEAAVNALCVAPQQPCRSCCNASPRLCTSGTSGGTRPSSGGSPQGPSPARGRWVGAALWREASGETSCRIQMFLLRNGRSSSLGLGM